MNQFKDVFTGLEKRDYTRAASSQKCVRAGVNINDLDEVGKNGPAPYILRDAGQLLVWRLFQARCNQVCMGSAGKRIQLPVERLWFSVYTDDDEAAALWEEIGAPRERILRLARRITSGKWAIPGHAARAARFTTTWVTIQATRQKTAQSS